MIILSGGRVLSLIDKHRSEWPITSTYVAATFLALIWLIVWLVVFFFTTAALGLSTGIIAFIATLWLSIISEAIIRFAENSTFVARLSKPKEPDAKGDNEDFDFGVAARLFCAGFTLLFLLTVVTSMMGYRLVSFTPEPKEVWYSGYILDDRAGLILRGDDCQFFKDADSLSITDGEIYPVKTEGQESVPVSASECPDSLKIKFGEKLVFSGLDQPGGGTEAIGRMLAKWLDAMVSWPFAFLVGLGFVMRVFIYKRKVHDGG
jgi:hypothetical protein